MLQNVFYHKLAIVNVRTLGLPRKQSEIPELLIGIFLEALVIYFPIKLNNLTSQYQPFWSRESFLGNVLLLLEIYQSEQYE